MLTSLEVGKAPLGPSASDADAPLVYHVTCRICHTHVYTLPKSKAKAPTQHAQGFDAASDAAAARPDVRAAEGYVRPTDGYVWITTGCIQEPGIAQVRASPAYSDLFGVAVPPCAQPRHLDRPELRASSSSRNAIMSPYALQSLPASLLGADAQRSDLATEIDAAALKALREHRARADREISALVRSKQSELDALVNRARDQVGVLAGLAKASRDIGGARSRSVERGAGRGGDDEAVATVVERVVVARLVALAEATYDPWSAAETSAALALVEQVSYVLPADKWSFQALVRAFFTPLQRHGDALVGALTATPTMRGAAIHPDVPPARLRIVQAGGALATQLLRWSVHWLGPRSPPWSAGERGAYEALVDRVLAALWNELVQAQHLGGVDVARALLAAAPPGEMRGRLAALVHNAQDTL